MALEAVDRPETQEDKIGPGHDEILLITDHQSAEWLAAQGVEVDVFIEKGYVKNAEELTAEYAPYEDASVFIGVKRHGQTIGSARLTTPDENGFKTINDARAGKLNVTEEGWALLSKFDLDTQGFEVGTMAIKDGFRSGPFAPDSVSASVYAGIVSYTKRYADQQGRDERGFVLASFDQHFFDNFSSAFGESVQPLGPEQMYMGSLTIPVIIDVEKLLSDDVSGLSPLLESLSQATQSDV
ncbi:MAG: hypothetical protein QG553_406 [Patescibacteria group bacterium]|nr:hypothetical protein [Patescibacteria group bacterium]